MLDRGRENRSQFVFTRARGREVVFWQSARTAEQARPNVALPPRGPSGRALEILVDVHERYPWTFGPQQATTVRRALPAGDYAVVDGDAIVATVERKSLTDLVATLTGGKLRYLLADLAAVPRAALVVEDRWSSVFKLERVRPAVVADGLAEAQVRFPDRPDPLLRDPSAGPGVDLPVPRRGADPCGIRAEGGGVRGGHACAGGGARRGAHHGRGPRRGRCRRASTSPPVVDSGPRSGLRTGRPASD